METVAEASADAAQSQNLKEERATSRMMSSQAPSTLDTVI
jgi:hypothetical protein